MIKPRTSDLIPEVLAMPERNRAERRRKRHACRAIVRSGYFRKHGDITNAAPALRDAADASTYTERLMYWAGVFRQDVNGAIAVDGIRERAAARIRGAMPPSGYRGGRTARCARRATARAEATRLARAEKAARTSVVHGA